VVFHDLRRVDHKHPLPDEYIWTLIGQAVLRLSTGRWPYLMQADGNPPMVSVVFPVRADGRLVHSLFERAIACQSDNDAVNWQVQSFRGLRHSLLKTWSWDLQELDRLLRERSRKVSTILRSLRPGRASAGSEKKCEAKQVLRPAWLLLFPDIYPSDF
jgi:hypothetical protein